MKPYRLLLPALAPALSAVVRLPRAVRASDRESFRGPALCDNVPVREEEEVVVDLPETAPPLELRFAQVPTVDLPLRVPLVE